MYSYEDRLRAVRLHIKLGKRVGLTIRQLATPASLGKTAEADLRQIISFGGGWTSGSTI